MDGHTAYNRKYFAVKEKKNSKAVLSRSDLGILSFLANSDLVAISQECLYANHLGDASQMERDEVVITKKDGIADIAINRTRLLSEKRKTL